MVRTQLATSSVVSQVGAKAWLVAVKLLIMGVAACGTSEQLNGQEERLASGHAIQCLGQSIRQAGSGRGIYIEGHRSPSALPVTAELASCGHRHRPAPTCVKLFLLYTVLLLSRSAFQPP